MLESQVIFEPPNGGFGWIVVFGSLLINMVNKAIFSVFGLLFGPFFNSINVAQSDIALVMNLTSFFGSLAAIFTGAILKFYTVRQVSVVACILTSIGLTLSAFTVSVYQTVLAFSVLAGIGFGLLANTTLIAVTSYFTTNKRRAVSFSLTGTGIGQIILPQIVKYLNNHFTANESIMIMGGLMLIGVIGAILFQPVDRHLKAKIIDETQSLTSPPINILDTLDEDNSSFWKKFIDTMDLGLLKDSRFVILNFVLACGYAVAIDFTLIFPFFLQETAKLDQSQTAMCLSVLATFDLFSRLTFHFMTDRTNLSSRQILVIGIFCLGILKTSLTYLTSYQSILIVCSIYGYFRAIVIVNQILAISEHCTKYYPKRFPGALGLNLVFCGISVVTFGQLFGIFRDHINNFSYSFYLEDVFILSVLSIWLVEYLYHLNH